MHDRIISFCSRLDKMDEIRWTFEKSTQKDSTRKQTDFETTDDVEKLKKSHMKLELMKIRRSVWDFWIHEQLMNELPRRMGDRNFKVKSSDSDGPSRVVPRCEVKHQPVFSKTYILSW